MPRTLAPTVLGALALLATLVPAAAEPPDASRTWSSGILAEFQAEAETTRRVLERVPAEHFEWRPHPTSRTLGTLAGHVAELPGLVTGFLAEDRLDFQTVDRTESGPASSDELMAQHEASYESLVAFLEAADDARLATPWTLGVGDQDVLTLPRGAVVRTFLLSHLIHHRGQLTVYLRMLEVPVPSVYGPSADEVPAFLAAALGGE